MARKGAEPAVNPQMVDLEGKRMAEKWGRINQESKTGYAQVRFPMPYIPSLHLSPAPLQLPIPLFSDFLTNP